MDDTGFLHAPLATLVLADRRILRANLMVADVFGWPPDELEGQSIRVLYPDQTDFDVIGARTRAAMETQASYSDERFMLRRGGQLVWMEAHGRALDTKAPQARAVWSFRPLSDSKVAGAAAGLTPSERRVAGYLVNGFTSKEIAQALQCSPRTIEAHRANMIRKMQVRNSFDLVSRLLGQGG